MTPALSTRDWVFLRKARRTAQQALFFLLHVGDVQQELDDVPPTSPKHSAVLVNARTYVLFALDQVASLIYSVHISRDYLPPGLGPDQVSPHHALPPAPQSVAFWRDRVWEHLNELRALRSTLRAAGPMSEGMAGGLAGPTPDAFDAFDANAGADARGQHSPALGPALVATLTQAAGLTRALKRFLRETEPRSWEGRIMGLLAEAESGFRRRLTFVLGVLVCAALLIGVEAVRSLIVNQGVRALLPLGLSALPPLLFLPKPARWLGLDWGRRAFFSPYAMEPEPTIARWPAGNPFTYRMTCEAAAGLGLLICAYAVVGVLLWVTFAHGREHTSFLTVFLSLALAAVIIRLATFLDRWDFIDERPVRLWALLVSSIIVLLILTELFWLLAGFLVVVGAAYLRRLVQRHAPWRLVVGVGSLAVIGVISAARAQTSRNANAWQNQAAGEWPRVAHWPMDDGDAPVVLVAASGGGSRAAIYTAKTLLHLRRELPQVAAHLQAISSVSGGSLASATYIARLAKGLDPSDVEDAVSNDFLLPTLVGALNPLSSRGTALEENWRAPGQGTPALGDLTLADLAASWLAADTGPEAPPPFPLPLFNTCTLDGHDVVVTPLARGMYTDASDKNWRGLRQSYALHPRDTPTWVVDRDGIYGLEDLLPRANVGLASAVRASANFPFGFPLVALDTCSDKLVLNPTQDPPTAAVVAANVPVPVQGEAQPPAPPRDCVHRVHVHLTDGGVLSNSGMWSLFPLITRPPTFATLARRGVLVILVEASKMPEYSDDRRSLLSLYGTLGDKNPVAQNLHRRMFSLLQRLYGDRLAVVQLDLIPEARPDSFNVYTTWALDPKSQEKLDQSFARVWATQAPRISQRFEALRARLPFEPEELLRPPLD